ncbi:MAG: glycosyl hydrolase [Gemmatimonadaceae bacterium]|nr:glycosyl hydrolase [Gemmatimonadaceae bacterium]
MHAFRRPRVLHALALALVAAAPAVAQRPRTSAAPAAAATIDTTLLASMRYRSIGPFRGGRSTAVAGVAAQPFLFYSGSTGGGVWRTEDAGQSWQPIADRYFGGAIGSIDVADSDPNVIYVGTGSQDIRGNTSTGRGMWKSTDAGKTWSFTGLRETGAIGRTVVHPTNPDLVYASALGHPFGKNRERGIYRSKDGGTTWQQVLFLNDSTGASDLVMHPRNPRILYAGMWRAERKPWTMISGGPEGGVYRSTDGGDTWTKLAGGLPTGIVGKVGLAISPANPDRIWALVEAEPAGGLFRSDDGGTSWTRVNAENKIRQRAWYFYRLVADPVNENLMYVMSVQMHRSVDGGKTFEGVAVPHGDTHDLWINPANPRLMVLGDDGGSVVSLNGAKSWSSMNLMPTAELYDVVVDNAFPYRVYTAQQDNTSISVPAWLDANTLHPMNAWMNAGGCETGPVALHPDHPEVIYGGCYGGAINRYEPKRDLRRDVIAYPQQQVGQKASDMKYRFQWVAPILVSRHDPNTVYHASQVVHRSRDGGMSWTVISPDLTTNDKATQGMAGGPINGDQTGVEMFNTIFALGEDPKDGKVLWTGSDDGRVHLTRDGGTTWTDVTPPGMPKYTTVNRIDVSRHQAGRAYVAAHRFRLDDFAPYAWRTDDYGRTWTRIADGTNGIPADHPVRVVREDHVRPGLLFAGTEFGIWFSTDNGGRWQSLQRNLPQVPISDLQWHENDLVVGTQGRSLWILDDLTPLQQLAETRPTGAMHLFRPRDVVRADKGQGGGAGGRETPLDAPPGGAVFHLHLRDSVTVPYTLEVRTAAGEVVRTLTTDTTESRRRQQPVLPVKSGTHAVTWDLTWPGPLMAPDQVLWGYTGGIRAVPGDYEVRLSGTTTQAHRFRVLADPRLTDVSAADYASQFQVARQLRDTLESLNRSLETMRAVKAQAHASLEQATRAGLQAELAPLATALDTRLDSLERLMTEPRIKVAYDVLRFGGRLDNQLAETYANVTGTNGYIHGGPEGRPTTGAILRTGELVTQWAPIAKRLDEILARDVAAFNAKVSALGLAPIVLPRKKPIA